MTTHGAATETRPVEQRAEAAGKRRQSASSKLRMLLIVNPKATTVSARLKDLIEHALRSRYQVEAIETEAPNHATDLVRDGCSNGFDLVVAFGGDGTVNEAANGLAHSGVPLTVLPGGCTNVFCRTLGIPGDVVDATEHLLALADRFAPRQVDLGNVNGRHFVSSSGVGLDAETTRWVDERTPLKSRVGPTFFAFGALRSFWSKYRGTHSSLVAEVDGERIEGVTAVIQNSDPYTYFKSRPVRVCEGAGLDNGTLSVVVLKRARHRDVPSLTLRVLSERQELRDHPQIVAWSGVPGAQIRVTEGAPAFPIQVDGDYIGDFTEATFSVCRGALSVVS
jgi:diacylglycerol kinase family enzyme